MFGIQINAYLLIIHFMLEIVTLVTFDIMAYKYKYLSPAL